MDLQTLYREAFPQVARMVRQLGGELETAKDLFHDALIIYMEKERQGRLDIQMSAKAYITGIAKILWLKQHRAGHKLVSLDVMEHHLTVPADFYTPRAAKPLLEQLKAAGKKCMELLRSFYYERKNMEEIAQEFHYSSARSATVQKYKCLEKVREQVKQSAYAETLA